MIKTAVVGACGKMGTQVVKEVNSHDDLELVLAVDKFNAGREIRENLVVCGDIEHALKDVKPDVIVDFTQPETIYQNVKIYLKNKIKSVIGTTGLTPSQIEEIKALSQENSTGIIIAPNFSIGAILMMKFAQMASNYFSNAEIIEYHHNQKKDAPSGTSIKTAQLMAQKNNNFKFGNCDEKETIQGARGANHDANIQIHAIRMPGFVASQEVIFGSDGQTLTIRHDTINRECYMSGVMLALRHVYQNNTFIYGLENIL